MRSFKWQSLFAAAMLAMPTLAFAQDAQNVNPNENGNDPFYAAPDPQAKPKVMTRIGVRTEPSPSPARKNMTFVTKTMQFGRMTDSIGLTISNVPPAMAAQLRLKPGNGVVVEEIAPGSGIESAGIEQYDVIEKVDGRAIRQPQDLTSAIREAKSDSVSIDIVRQAKHRSLNVDRSQLQKNKAFTFGRAGGGGFGGGGIAFGYEPKPRNLKQDQDPADRDRDQADRERAAADREREKADRDRDRELDRAKRAADRVAANRGKQEVDRQQRDQINQMRQQLQSTLDRERGELDRAREQLNRATQEMNQRLNDLRKKLDTEIRQKMEEEFRKGQDQLRQKMELLDQQTRDLQKDEQAHDEHEEKN